MFHPNPRVGSRQQSCSRSECREERKRRAHRAWAERNPAYWTELRLAKCAAAAEARCEERAAAMRARLQDSGGAVEVPEEAVVCRAPPAIMRELPQEFTKDALGIKGLAVMGWLLRTVGRLTSESADSRAGPATPTGAKSIELIEAHTPDE